MTIEASKITDRRIRSVPAFVSLRCNPSLRVGNKTSNEQSEMALQDAGKDNFRWLVFYRPAELARIGVSDMTDGCFVGSLGKSSKRFRLFPQVTLVLARGVDQLPQIESACGLPVKARDCNRTTGSLHDLALRPRGKLAVHAAVRCDDHAVIRVID